MTPSIIRFRPLTFYKSPLELRASLRTRHPLHPFAIELICDMHIMSRSLAPARPLLNSLWKQPARPCRRLLSSQSSQARRPTAASQTASPRHQPLMQRRFKYKTVEEAKSRYRSGVSRAACPIPSPHLPRKLTPDPPSPSRGKQVCSLSRPVRGSSTISSARRDACSANEWPTRTRAWDDPRLEARSS